MPLDKLVLLIVVVIAAAGATVWLGAFVVATMELPLLGWGLAIPVLLVGYVLWRVISERLTSKEDSHYDQIDK